jgi:signal transduction histidine kinase
MERTSNADGTSRPPELVTGAPLPLPAENARRRPHASPELRRILANIRVIIAIVAATEALSLGDATRTSTLLAVLGYAAYAGGLCWVELNGSRQLSTPLTSWIDALWILLIVWLANAPGSLFVLLLLFPVLFSSLAFGFLAGLAISLFSAAAAAAEILLQSQQQGGHLNMGALLQPGSILVLGPLVAGLSRAGVQMNTQQAVSAQLLAKLDPRDGSRQVAETLLRIMNQHFDADSALMLLSLPDCPARLFRYPAKGAMSESSGALRDTLIESLSRLPADVASAHHRTRIFNTAPFIYYSDIDVRTRSTTGTSRILVEELAEQLDAHSLLTVPICRRSPRPSRLVFLSHSHRYRASDAELLCSVMDQIAPLIENASLLERLTEEAMATERARIGRDLHDNAIQPYLGLKYGIEALARRAGPDNPVYHDVQAILAIVTDELHQLRELISGMRTVGKGKDDNIGPVLRRQARRFAELFGLEVGVECDDTLNIGRRLTAEIFPIVGEALTNIRRHTRARRAEIHFSEDLEHYLLRISNPKMAPTAPFMPRSIVERAEFLHGCAVVDLQRDGFTDLMVTIPKPPRTTPNHD